MGVAWPVHAVVDTTVAVECALRTRVNHPIPRLYPRGEQVAEYPGYDFGVWVSSFESPPRSCTSPARCLGSLPVQRHRVARRQSPGQGLTRGRDLPASRPVAAIQTAHQALGVLAETHQLTTWGQSSTSLRKSNVLLRANSDRSTRAWRPGEVGHAPDADSRRLSHGGGGHAGCDGCPDSSVTCFAGEVVLGCGAGEHRGRVLDCFQFRPFVSGTRTDVHATSLATLGAAPQDRW